MNVAILIPVYNAFQEALACLESVARCSPGARVLVIDDASPEGEFALQVSPRLKTSLALEVIRMITTSGFLQPATEDSRYSGKVMSSF